MKKLILFGLLVFFFLSFQSCQKEPDGYFYAEPEPVFHVEGMFGNSDIKVEAGREDFYMFTSFEKSDDSLAVYVFEGRFAKLDACLSECDEAFSISIRDNKLFDEDIPGGIDKFDRNEYGFVGSSSEGSDIISYLITFEDKSFSTSGNAAELEWSSFSTALGIDASTFTESFDLGDLTNGIPIALSAIFEGDYGCEATFDKLITVDEIECFHDISFDILPQAGGANYIVAPYNADNPDWEYSWDSSNFSDTLTIDSPGTYCLTVTNSYGCSAERCISIANLDQNPDLINYCYAAFSIEVVPNYGPAVENEFDFSKVIISYTTKDGVEYRSDRSFQPSTSYFRVDSEVDYELNEKQESTRRLQASFECTLYDETGQQEVRFENGVTSIGIAIPE